MVCGLFSKPVRKVVGLIMSRFNIKFQKKQNTILFRIACVIFIFFFFVSTLSLCILINRNAKKTIEYIEYISKSRAETVYQLLEGNFLFLQGIATTIRSPSLYDSVSMIELFTMANSDNHFVRIGLANINGKVDFVNPDGTTVNDLDLSAYEFFQKALDGNISMSETFYDAQTEQNINYYAVPIMSPTGNGVQKVLCAVISCESLLAILNESLPQDEAYFVLVNNEGVVVSPIPSTISIIQTGSNIFDVADFEQTDMLLNTLQTERNGVFEMKTITLHRKIVIEPLNINGWSILCLVPQQTVDDYFNITAIVVFLVVLDSCILFLMYWLLRLFSRNNRELEKLAYYDPLTGARNYTKFLLDAQKLLQTSSKKHFAIWSADLKKFKLVNSIWGTSVGDKVLKRVATVLEEYNGNNFIFCHVSADQFAGIRAYEKKEELSEWFHHLELQFADREIISKNKITSDAAIGFYCLDDFDVQPTIEEMVNNATIAKSEAKVQTGSQLCFFTSKMGAHMQQEALLESSGKSALKRGEITFFVQPKVNIQNGFHISGGEVLLRWKHPSMGWISPGKFLPLFEKNGFIVEVDRYIFEQACVWYNETKKQCVPIFQLAINVARQGLLQNDFVDYYSSIKEKYGIADGVLELEFTESTPLDDYILFRDVVIELQNCGFICSIDDFGAGYSSLKVLKDLPVNVLKLDAAFFQKDITTQKEQIIVSDFISIAQKLQIKVVAEGIESSVQVDFLQEVGCDMIQGYIFSKPLSPEIFISILTKNGGAIEMQQPNVIPIIKKTEQQ